jgi:acyl-coenzyme A thioesterase PaaI-like protein
MRELPHTHSCFVCGESNPSGLRLRFETDGKVVLARFTPRPEHIGFQNTIHGGIISTILDEIMVWACAVQTRRFAYCAELTVRFNQPARPGAELLVIGELTQNRRNRIFEARAELKSSDGVTLAGATGKYLPMAEGEVSGMLRDFVGDPADLLPTAPGAS